jgi:hypothetical protein
MAPLPPGHLVRCSVFSFLVGFNDFDIFLQMSIGKTKSLFYDLTHEVQLALSRWQNRRGGLLEAEEETTNRPEADLNQGGGEGRVAWRTAAGSHAPPAC